ncbi:hypothetical protein RJT34_28631 [Clitoria ternatea]|uniref:C2H2-type domain-containing protein n=1 Tax=Clitoria ternatea TaxID=43366 RepID=A0AAN9IH20_CLITE
MLSQIMDMEGMGMEEHVMGSCNNNHDATNIAKGKRTKRRLKPLSPFDAVPATTTITSSCSSASGGGGSFSSTTFEGTDQEEEDMANCLILLAQGGGDSRQVKIQKCGVNTKLNFYVYECKTCNRTFPSFQALGGHRASHKKPKLTQDEKKLSSSSPSPPLLSLPPPSISQVISDVGDFEEGKHSDMKISPMVSLQLGCGNSRTPFQGNVKSKIHECSICGAEFTSGQALGGHMRRHRAISSNNNNKATCDEVKPRGNVLELDLNLPAPEDDLRDSKFQFPSNQSSMVLSAAPALVGCHY